MSATDAIDLACTAEGSQRRARRTGVEGFRWHLALAFALAANFVAGGASALDRRVATTGTDSGPCTTSSCATLTYALGQAVDGDTIVVGFNQTGNSAFAEHLLVNKSVTIRGQGSDPSGTTFSSIVSPGGGIPALFTVQAPNVVIRDLYFAVDFADTAQAIRAESSGSFTSQGLLVDDVHIRAESSAAPAFAYGQRNAIWINPTSGPAFSATVTDSVIDDTTAPAARFRAGIDARQAGLTATDNDIISINHDLYVVQHPAGFDVALERNFLRGFGVQYAAPLAGAGTVLIDDNDFVPDADLAGLVSPAPAGDFSAMRLISNGVGQTVTVSNNVFAGHERSVLIENFPGVTLQSNTFSALVGSSQFEYVVLSNKELFSNAVPPLPLPQSLSLTATGNVFNAGSVAGTGTAVTLLNDNAQGAPLGGYYGAITFAGNNFVGNLGRYFELGGFTCASSNDPPCPLDPLYSAVNASMPGTPVAKFAGDVDATGANEVNGTPIAALTAAQRSAVLARTRDSGFDSDLGTVDYGFDPAPDEVFVDADYAGESYGDELSFVHSGVNGGAAYPVHFGITGFATLQDALAEVDDAGTIYVAAGIHSGTTIGRHVTVIGDDGSVNGDTVFNQQLVIAASGADAANRLTLRNLTVTNPAGDGIRVLGSRSFLHLDGVSAVDNADHGMMVFTNDGLLGDSTTTDLLIEDSHFDRNGDPNANLRVGLIFDEEANVQGLRIIDSTFDDNSGAGLSFNDLGAPSSITSIDAVHISGSSFSRNNPLDVGNGGGGLWLKTSGAGSSITDVLVETSTFADNGTGQLNGGLVNRRINANGVSVRARPDTVVDDIVICANTFSETVGVGGVQEAGIYVFDDTLPTNQGYQPVEVCASNTFTNLPYSVSGHEQRGARNTQPIVFVTGGSVLPAPEEINVGFVVNENTNEQFRTINAAIADADTLPGHSIFAPAGLYHENVLIGKADLTVRGDGSDRTRTIIDGRARAGSGVSFGPTLGGGSDGVTGATLRDLTVRGFEAIGTSGGACIFGPDGSDGSTVRNVLVHNCLGGRGGIFFAAGAGVDDLDIDGNEIHTSDGRGIVVWDGLKTNIRIVDNLVRDMNGCCGIELQDGRASGVTVTGNTVRNVGDSGMSFIQLDGSTGPNLIAGNTVENFSGRFGIEIKIPNGTGSSNEAAPGSIVVRDNVIRHTGAPLDSRDLAGIGVTRRAFINQYGQVDIVTGVVLSGNTVHGFRQPLANEGHGIVVEGEQMRVFGNVLYDNEVALQRQAGNEPGSLPGDSNQAAQNTYFSRGNAPTVCADLNANQFGVPTPNGEDLRDVLPAGVETAGARVTNLDTSRIYCSLQAAIDDASTLDDHTLELADGATFSEQVLIDKRLRLTRSNDGIRPVIRAPASVTDLALFRVAAPGVEIDGLRFEVDLSRVGEAIRSVGNTAGGEPDGLSIHDNEIVATASAAGFVAYGRRNAISLNMSNASGYAPAGEQVTTLTVDVRRNVIGGTQDWDGNAGNGNQPAYFRSAIAIDQGEGVIADNELRGRDYDLFARFTNGAAGLDIGLAGEGNRFAGGGLYLGDGIADVRISANDFDPDRSLAPFDAPFTGVRWGDLGLNGARLVNLSDTVVLSGNTFDGHTNAVFAQNFVDLDLVGNTFNAPTDPAQTEFRHLILGTKVVSTGSASVAQVPLAIDATGNSFNGGTASQTAIAVELVNHDADNDSYGTLNFGGAVPADRNDFSGDFDFYFRLDPTQCTPSTGCAPAPYSTYYALGSASATDLAPFGGDVEASNNAFDGVLPAAMSFAQLSDLQTRTYHDDPDAPESPAAPSALGIVNYGFAPSVIPTITTIVSTAPNPSAIEAAVTVTVNVANALGGTPTGSIAVSAPGSAGCSIAAYPATTSCTIAAGPATSFTSGGAKLVTATFTPTPAGSVNQASSDDAVHYVTYGSGAIVPVEPAPTPTPADNDYTRINDAIQSAGPGVTIELDGDFNWLEPNALASWAAGSNGVAGDGDIFHAGGDDWSVRLPAGVNGVIVRAAPGGASVQGSEGLPGNDFDDFTAFAVAYSTNQGWTFQGLTLRGFDLAIGMFVPDYNSGDRFNGTQLLDNVIEIGPDSGDDYGNYGLYAGYGEAQSISANAISISIQGADGSPGPGPNSRTVGIQIGDSCNVDCFDGLLVSANQISVGGVPAGAPPRVIGLWENAGDANSSITIEDNAFSGSGDLGGGVDANNQTAFIATTQSNGARTSSFRGNSVSGAAIGLRSQLPIYGHYVVSDAPLQIEGNTFTGNGTALRLHGAYPAPGRYVLRHNRIAGNSIGLYAERADDLPAAGDPGYGGDELPSVIDANDNWWGCNEGPGAVDCDDIQIEAGADPAVVQQALWLQLRASATPDTIVPPAASAIAVDLVSSSDGSTIATGFPDATPIGLTTTKGTLNPAAPFVTTAGATATSLQGHVSGVAFLAASLDAESVPFTVTVVGPVTVNDDTTGLHLDPRATCPTPDFASIQDAIDFVTDDTEILVCSGLYDESITVDHPVSLIGAQVGIDARTRAVAPGDEAIIVPAAEFTGGLEADSYGEAVVSIEADGVGVDGFVIDGDNPALTSGFALNGADPELPDGVISTGQGLVLRNTILRNFPDAGVWGEGSASAGGSATITRNRFNNITSPGAYGLGVYVNDNYYLRLTDNLMDQVAVGFQNDNNYLPAPSGFVPLVADNEIHAAAVGIFYNLVYQSATPYALNDNTIIASANAGETGQWRGIWIESIQSSQTVTASDNDVDGAAVDGSRQTLGYQLNNIATDQAANSWIDGGTLANVDVGVLATDATFYTGVVNDFVVRNLSFNGIGFSALYVEDTTEVAGSARISIGAGMNYGASPRQLTIAGAAPSVGYVDAVAGTPQVFVRSARDFFYGLPIFGGGAPCGGSGICSTDSAPVNSGIGAVTVGGVVTLEAGTFPAAVAMNKADVTLRGAQAGVHGTDPVREADLSDSNESVVTRPTIGALLTLSQGGLVVDGLTLRGTVAGHAVNNLGGAAADNLQFVNNRVRNIVDGSGITSEPGADCNADGFLISRNLFRAISGGGATNGRGVRLGNGHCNVDILDNDFESVTYAVNANGGAGTVQDVEIDGNRVDTTSATALVITGTTGVAVTRNRIENAASGLFISDRMTDFVASCNVIGAANNGISTFAFFGDAPNIGVRIFHNAIAGGSADVNNALAQGLIVGSNWYGGSAAGTTNSGGPLLVADALPADPVLDVNCGDNTPVELVLYPASGTPQSADLNQPFALPLRSRVQDVLGGAVVGESVTVLAPAAGASATLTPAPANGPLPTLTTDYNGVAEVTAVANGFAGSYDVSATHASNAVAFALTNVALEQVLFDLNGPVGGVEVGDTVPYTGLIANSNPNVDENVRIRVQIGADSALDPDDVQLCVINPSDTSQCLPVTMTDDGATLSFDFPDVFGDLDGFDVTSPLPYEFLHNFRVVFGKAGVFTTDAQVVGVDTPTVYASDTLTTEVVAQHAGVALDLTGPVAGVEKDVPTAYSARLTNTEAAVADNVVVEFVLTRTGGIQAGDVTVEYDLGGGNFAAIPLIDAGGQLEAVFGPPTGFALPSGYDATTALRVTYHVAPHTFAVAATVIDAVGDSDGVAAYAADNLATEVIEADPDLALTLSGLFDTADGTTLIAAQVAQPAILRAELVNAGGDVPDLVQAAFTIAPDFSGITATDVVASYWFVPALADACAPVPPIGDRETVVFSVASDTLTAVTDPQPIPEDFELAVCFQLEFVQPGVYNIAAVIEDAVPDTDGQSDYAADNLAVTVADANAVVTLNGLGTFVFDGNPHAAGATTTPAGLSVDITYVLDNGAPTTTAPVEAGTYAVTGRIADGQGYGGIATGTITITPKPVTITLGGDAGGTFVYDGSSRIATASVTGIVPGFPLPVSPAPGSLQISYNGSAAAPVDAGAYTVLALFDPPSAVRNYVALPAVSSIQIIKRTIAVTIDGSDLVQVFDGSPRLVDASYVLPPPPAAQTVAAFEVTYDGSPTPPTAVGAYTVVATVIDANYEGSASATLSVVAAALDRIELAAVAAVTATVDSEFNGSTGDDACALVSDVNDDPVANVAVTFATPADGASASLSSNLVLTDASGIACVAARANKVAGSYDLDASVAGIAPDAIALSNLADDAADQVELAIIAGNGQTAPVGTPFTVALQVAARDRFGNVLADAAFAPVFTAPASEPTAALGAVTQNGDGSWQVIATAGAFAGAYGVGAALDTPLACDSGLCAVTFGLANTTAAPVDVALVSDVPSNTVGAPGGDYTLTATVTDGPDGTGNGVSGVSVTFVLEPGANGAGTTISSAADLTDASGVATAVLPANSRAGEFTVRAVVSGVTLEGATPDSVDLTNLAGAADALQVVAGDGQSVAVETAFLDLVVRVVDAFDNPVAGTDVSFTAGVAPGGASATVAATPIESGVDGLAASSAIANDVAGSYSVQASASGLTSVSFGLSNTLGSIAITNLRWDDNDATSIVFDAADQLVAFDTSPAVDAADCDLTYNGLSALPRDAGTWLVQVTCSNDGFSGTAGALLTITPATLDVTLGDLSQVFDGGAKVASVVTTPAGVDGVTLEYSQSGNPVVAAVQAGTYDVAVDLDNPNYVLGTVSPSSPQLVIAPATVTLTFSNLSQVYDGGVKSVEVTTTPAGVAGLTLAYTPDAAPVNAGSYTVQATLSNPNYVLSGTTSATLTITQATAQIFLSNLTQIFDGSPKSVGVATVPASLAGSVAVSYDGSATAPSAVGNYAVVASLTGQQNYADVSVNATMSIVAAAISQFVVDSANPIAGTAGAALPSASLPTVRVLDTNGNGVAGVSILFELGADSGSATGLSATTDANGRATVGSWTLDRDAGSDTMTARVNGLAGLPTRTFTANGAESAGVSLSKTSATTEAQPFDAITYSIVVAHAAGPSNAAAVDILDALPDGLDVANASWLCTGSTNPENETASCDLASGSGDIDVTAAIPVGTQITITLTATVEFDAPIGALVNEASAVLTSSTDPDTSNNEDSHTVTISPLPSGPCSVFCDGFEGESLRLVAQAQPKSLGGDMPRVKLPTTLSEGTPQELLHATDSDGEKVASLDVLRSGTGHWARLRHRDAAGAERFSAWQPLEGGSVGLDWALDFDGVVLAAGASGEIRARLAPGQALPYQMRSRHRIEAP